MLIIHSAFYQESKFFIEYYKLKKNLNFKAFDLYESENISVLVSGIGNLNSAICLTHYLSMISDLSKIQLLNFGFAAGSDSLKLGNLYKIHKISKADQSQAIYPDLTLSTKLPTLPLINVDQPAKENPCPEQDCLVDMESLGLATAASKFLKTDQVHFLKIIADHFSDSFYSAEQISEMIKNCFTELEEYIEQLLELQSELNNTESTFRETREIELAKAVDRLALTDAQTRELEDLFRQYEVITKKEISNFFLTFLYPDHNTKFANKKTFHKLLGKLKIEISKKI